MSKKVSTETLSSALDEFNKIKKKIAKQDPVIFLDYDGTLTPIVSRPENAKLSDAMRDTIRQLSKKYRVVIISGRDLSDLRQRIALSNIYYAGNHGFDILGPQNLKKQLSETKALLPVLAKAEKSLKEIIQYQGSQIERKQFSIAVHYRNVAEKKQEQLIQKVKKLSKNYKNLKLSYGKKVLELQPAIDWHKGKALLWLLKKMPLSHEFFPIYIGDDLTDEDAFSVLDENALGIIVIDDESRETMADYALKNTNEVQAFLHKFIGEDT